MKEVKNYICHCCTKNKPSNQFFRGQRLICKLCINTNALHCYRRNVGKKITKLNGLNKL